MELENEIGITIFNRTNKGIIVSNEGAKFLGYAKQVIEQAELLESRYSNKKSVKQNFYDNEVSKFSNKRQSPKFFKFYYFRAIILGIMMTVFILGVYKNWGDLYKVV